MTEVEAVALFGGLLLAAVGVGEGLRRLGWRAESTRRIVHMLVGLATAAAPFWFVRPRGIALLAVVFVVGNAVAHARRWLPGVHGIARRSWGTVVFPLALLVALLLCWGPLGTHVWAMQIAFAVLALADPAASLVGTRVKRPGPFRVGGATKSLAGSSAFAVIAFAVVAVWMTAVGLGTPGAVALAALSAALLATLAEALGRSGWDNLWIVLATIVALVWWEGGPAPSVVLGSIAAASVFAWVTWRVRALDLSGALAGALLAWGLVALGGVAWAVPALAFFVLSSAWSRVGRARKASADVRTQKGSRRDAAQVLANGGAAMAALAATVFVPSGGWYWAFVACFAAAAADTWGTEIGTWVGGATRWLGVGPTVPPGTSGGMSLAGTLGVVAGAGSVVGPALWLVPDLRGAGALALVGLGLGAAVLDSALGATLQARYRLPDGSLTERPEANGAALPLAAGVRWLDNDGVNAVCTVAAAAAGWAAWLWLG